MEQQWYQTLFANYARQYDEEVYTQGTQGEADFLERELEHDRTRTILDIGCGTGRHDIELATRGYRVTGVDLSAAQLARAREKAAAAGVSVDFRQGDARELDFVAALDLVMMVCEGGFCLMETDEMNYRILQGACRALKPGGKLVLTTLNALFPLARALRPADDAAGEGPPLGSFDPVTFRNSSSFEFSDDDGVPHTIHCTERYYAPCEMHWMLGSLGMTDIGIYGCELGRFSRERAPGFDDVELLVIARQAAS
ncbi:methyltransferase domain-containing protein [bacterium]|nr:methyltransferase domain-containing protein [bacterium]